jgi:hypothetical protein
MVIDHPWTGVTHDLADIFSHFGFIAMYCAFSARRFLFLEPTVLKTFPSIMYKLEATGAELLFRCMMRSAIE